MQREPCASEGWGGGLSIDPELSQPLTPKYTQLHAQHMRNLHACFCNRWGCAGFGATMSNFPPPPPPHLESSPSTHERDHVLTPAYMEGGKLYMPSIGILINT